MDTLYKLLTVLVITFSIYPELGDTSCEQIQKPENKTLQVCREQSLTSADIYLDSDGAPVGNNITCSCSMERSRNMTLNVTISSIATSIGDGITFQIPIAGYDYIYNAIQDSTFRKPIVLEDSTIITFNKTNAVTSSAICLSLVGSSANFTVKCHQHELIEVDTTEGETNPPSTTSELSSTGSSGPVPVDQEKMNKDSLPRVLIIVIAASVAAVLLAAIVAAVIFIIFRKSRRQNNQTSAPMKKSTNNRTQVWKTPGYDYAEECPFNNLRYPAEQQRSPQIIARVDHETNSYAEISELGQQSSCAGPYNDKHDTSACSKRYEEETDTNYSGAKRREKEAVYNTVGVTDIAYVTTGNVYNTAGISAEGVYNTLNETLGAKIASENV